MKVICAGAPKTGTKSVAKALRLLGYDQVYDFEESVEFGFDEWEKILQGEQPNLDQIFDRVYSKDVEAVVDMPHSYFFDKFLERWPNAKVILMVRDEDSWFRSYTNMLKEGGDHYSYLMYILPLSKSMRRFLKFVNTLFEMTVGDPQKPNAFLWKTWYRRHNAYVRATVPEDQLLVFEVGKGWEPMCSFLGKDIPSVDFPIENKATGDKMSKAMHRAMNEPSIVKKAQGELKRAFATIISISVLAIACVLYYAWI